MPYTSDSMLKVVRMEFDVVFIILGIIILVGGTDTSLMKLWLPLTLTLAGIFMLGSQNIVNTSAALLVMGIGLYLLLRAAGIISLPILRYAIGSFIILISTVNLIKNVRGGSVSLGKTFQKVKKNNV